MLLLTSSCDNAHAIVIILHTHDRAVEPYVQPSSQGIGDGAIALVHHAVWPAEAGILLILQGRNFESSDNEGSVLVLTGRLNNARPLLWSKSAESTARQPGHW